MAGLRRALARSVQCLRRNDRLNINLDDLRSSAENLSLTENVSLLLPRPKRNKHGFDQMSYDIGFEQAHNESAVREFIERVDATFDLVMVAERISEALVLLRHLLCWEVDDVVVFKHNARQAQFRRPVSTELAAERRALNPMDTLLYKHFTRRFEQRIKAFGRERMQKETYLLEQRINFWYQHCVEEEFKPLQKHKFVLNFQVLDLKVKNASSDMCRSMIEPEKVVTRRLRNITNDSKDVESSISCSNLPRSDSDRQ